MSGVGKINTSLSSDFNSKINSFNSNSFTNSTNSTLINQTESFDVSVNSNSSETSQVKTAFLDVAVNDVNQLVSNPINSLVVDTLLYFEDVEAKISENVSSILSDTQSTLNVAYDWWKDDAFPFVLESIATIHEVCENVDATFATTIVSLVEGLSSFAEAIVDCGAILGSGILTVITAPIDGVHYLLDLITGNNSSSITKDLWNQTMGFVSNKYVTGWFDKLYEETKFGNWMRDNAYFFDDIRSIGSGIGYVAGIVILTICTAGIGGAAVGGSAGAGGAAGATTGAISSTQLGITAGLAGLGQGTEQSWSEGANAIEGLAYGTANAAWEFLQFFVGGEISRAGGWGDQFAKKIVSNYSSNITNRLTASLGRVIADGATGGLDGVVRPGLSMIYKKGYYDDNNNYVKFDDLTDISNNYAEIFNDFGGWSNVLTNALVGSVSSAFGEVFDLNRLGRNTIDRSLDGVDAKVEVNENNIATMEKDLRKTKLIDEISNSDDPKTIIKSLDERTLIEIANQLSGDNQKIINDILRINSLTVGNITNILTDDELVKKYKDDILEKILHQQDSIFINNDGLINSYLNKIIDGDIEFYKLLSDDNIIRFFSLNSTNTAILDEIINRLNNGNHIFSRYTINFFGKLDSDNAFLKLDNSLQQQVKNLLLEDCSFIPDDIKNFNYVNLCHRALFGKMIKDGRITDVGLNFIKELTSSNNINILTQFNFELLDNHILNKLDINYVKEIGVYDKLSSKIVALSKNEKIFNIFVDIINSSNADNSLSTFYTKTECCLNFLLENMDLLSEYDIGKLNIDEFVNYILFDSMNGSNGKKIKLIYDENYTVNFRNECDRLFQDADELDDMKNIFFQKYFSLTKNDADSYLSKYFDDIQNVLRSADNQSSITLLSLFKKIIETDDVNYLRELYGNQNFYMTAEEMLNVDGLLKKMYAETYVNKLSTTTADIINSRDYRIIDYNGDKIKLIEAGNEFSFLVHSTGTGYVKSKTSLINNNYVNDWYNIDARCHGLATSYITSSNIGSAPVKDLGVLYGFTNINANDIAIMSPYDIKSYVSDYGFKSLREQKYMSADNMSSNTLRVYNEVVVDRKSVKPDCVIIYDDSIPETIKNAFNAAKDWDIPVVRINKTQLAVEQIGKINSLIRDFRQTANIDTLKECVDLYERNINGYGLNFIVNDAKKGITNSINVNNVSIDFSSDQIENAILEFLDHTNSISEIESLIRVLDNIKYRYDLVNSVVIPDVMKTESSISINSLIDYANQRKEYIYE